MMMMILCCVCNYVRVCVCRRISFASLSMYVYVCCCVLLCVGVILCGVCWSPPPATAA